MDEILRKRIEQAAIEGSKHYDPNVSKYSQGKQVGYVRGFKAGAEFALSHQWISVDEALPDDWEYVLVMHKPMSGARNKISIAYLHPTVHSKAWNVEGIECYLNKTNPDDNIVYAWMHIPELNDNLK